MTHLEGSVFSKKSVTRLTAYQWCLTIYILTHTNPFVKTCNLNCSHNKPTSLLNQEVGLFFAICENPRFFANTANP